MDYLVEYNKSKQYDVEARVKSLRSSHENIDFDALSTYPLTELKDNLGEVIGSALEFPELQPNFKLISREKFGGDIAINFPQLLKDGGPKNFISAYQPKIVDILNSETYKNTFSEVVVKGMYINVTLAPDWLKASVDNILNSHVVFGRSNTLKDKSVMVEYSSPNAAKTLHAGHIRSTIIGHVIGNIYEAAGAMVYRINHINDFGGFGFILEGYDRFSKYYTDDLSNNDKLVEIYKIRRTLEKVTTEDKELSDVDAADKEILAKYIPEASSLADLKAYMQAYTEASDKRFELLESGDAETVKLWQQMIEWSLTEFNKFYDLLNLSIEFDLGESFYFPDGNELVETALKNGTAIKFTEELAKKELEKISSLDLSDKEKEHMSELVEKDIDATLVPLSNNFRYVVLRKDGRSIYATRDLGAVKKRVELFDPTDIIYVVGQEQSSHFSKLFEASEILGLLQNKPIRLKHIYFGFYVDSETGKKLSSRESAAGVLGLLQASHDYFKNKLSTEVFSEEEREKTAQQLTVGSIVFNDLKQDSKTSVEINAKSLEATIEGFEKSGGAYVLYAACRAKAIIRKVSAESYDLSTAEYSFNPEEVALILKILEVPELVVTAATKDNPTLLVKHLYELASQFNTYYAKYRVIEDGTVNQSRLLLTNAVGQALSQALGLCHIECPERI